MVSNKYGNMLISSMVYKHIDHHCHTVSNKYLSYSITITLPGKKFSDDDTNSLCGKKSDIKKL